MIFKDNQIYFFKVQSLPLKSVSVLIYKIIPKNFHKHYRAFQVALVIKEPTCQ